MKLSGFSTTIANIDYRRQARYQCESDFAVRFQRLPPSGFVLQASEGIASTEASRFGPEPAVRPARRRHTFARCHGHGFPREWRSATWRSFP